MTTKANGVSSSSRRTRKAADQEAARSNLRAQGLRTRSMIVQAATELLLQRGGLDFTLRAVARQAKISLGNLRYYFPDREELLRAVLSPVFEAYLADLDRVLNSDAPPKEVFDALLERGLRDAKDSKAMALMWHFAARSTVDPECARVFGEWYDTLVRGIAKLLERINPDLTPDVCIRLSVLAIAMSDGFGFLLQSNGKRSYLRDLDADFRTLADFLVHHHPLVEREKPVAKKLGR